MDDSKIFIVGAKGQLGLALQAQYPGAQNADIDELDITDKKSVERFDWSGIEVILNAAAYTNVDGAETAEGRVSAWAVNADAVANLVAVSAQHDMTIIHISTDYVFDGTRTPHTEDEPFSPLSVYGASKAAGDLIISLAPKFYILRTSWVIGEGKNFVRTMLELGQKGVSPSVVADQIGRLTFTSELVRAIDHLLTSQTAPGTYNVSNEGTPASWADITREIFKDAGFNLAVTDTTTAEYYSGKTGIAPRPLQSTLDLAKLHAAGFESRDWKDDLAEYVKKELK
ncbi:MAG TPA: NAD(P)-dependent oxidoreductase [Candidatus Saccharimonadales bacterium]|nr:NAD(P)-dependent oxidoreductase [Candidatus Saccharimonadales bacterium]